MTELPGNAAKAFKFPIPTDPLRLLYGIRKRWYWFLLLPGLLGTIGWLWGSTKTENRYSVSLQLIKSEVPTTIQTSEAGQAFKPRDLSDDTLLATTYSTEVLSRTAARLDHKRSPGEVKSMIEIAKQRNTSLFYLTAHSRVSAEDAINTVHVWAEEVIRFTNNLQREEARQMEAFISEQLEAIDSHLVKVNRQILDFARTNNFVDVDHQTENTLSTMENIRSEFASKSIELQTKELQINRYRQELRSQSPYEADLKRKREELTYLRGRYTDENPLVKEKLYEIDHINEELESIGSGDIKDLKDFTGSDLGNNLYLEILALQNEKIQLEKQVADLAQRLDESKLQVAELPEKALRLSELKSRRFLLIDAQALLESRRTEASFYETKAPGYWQIFQKPSVSDVGYSSQNVKALFLAVIGVFGGLCIAFFTALIWEMMQSGLRTPLEAAIVTNAYPLFSFVTQDVATCSWWNRHLFPENESVHNERSLRKFWLTHALSDQGEALKRFLFTPIEVCGEELVFWVALLDFINLEGYKVRLGIIGNRGDSLVDKLSKHACVISCVTEFDQLDFDSDAVTIVHLSRIPTINDVHYLKAFESYYMLNSPSIATRQESQHRSEIFQRLIGPSNGLIILDQAAQNTLPRALKSLEMKILNILATKVKKEE